MASETPSTYRGRLRIEGVTLAALGGVGSVALLVLADGATDGPASTIGQLVVVAVLLGIFGPRGVRSAITEAMAVGDLEAAGTGEPTPLWHLPPVVVLAAPFLVAGLPDAALRVTGGCVLVDLAQAVLLAGLVGRDEQATGPGVRPPARLAHPARDAPGLRCHGAVKLAVNCVEPDVPLVSLRLRGVGRAMGAARGWSLTYP